MTIPSIITVKQAKKQNMEPLTTTMSVDDRCLQQVCKDMDSVMGTKWALVHEGNKRVAVWRVPNVPFK